MNTQRALHRAAIVAAAVLAITTGASAQEPSDPPPEAPPVDAAEAAPAEPAVDATSEASAGVPAAPAATVSPPPSAWPSPGPSSTRPISPPSATPRTAAPMEATQRQAAPEAEEEDDDVSQDRLLHGFRLGYLFTANIDAPYDPERSPDESYRQHYDIASPHQFIFGYELTWRMIGHDWLNVLLVGNILIAGLEQSHFFPSLNGLLGFEIDNTFQIGVGVNLAPTKDRAAHMLVAAGWTPQVGRFYIPVHFFFVPDVYGHHRFGLTTGVSF